MPAAIKAPYQIVAKGANQPEAEMRIFGDIGEDFWGEGITDERVAADLDALNDQDLRVRVNSYGGSVAMGLAIANAISNYAGKTTGVIEGVSASISSMIPLACDHVEIADNARMMVHGPHAGSYGFSDDHREAADMLDGFADAMSRLYIKKTGKSADEIMGLLTDRKDHWFGAEEALAFGLADEITEGLRVAAHGFMQSRFAPSAIAAFGEKPLSQLFDGKQSSTTAAVAANNPQPEEVEEMPDALDKDDKAAKPKVVAKTTQVADPNVPAARSETEVLAANDKRIGDIRAAFQPFAAHEGVQALLDGFVGDSNITVEVANNKLLAHLGSGTEPLARSPHIEHGEDSADKQIKASMDVLLVRAGVHNMRGNGQDAVAINLSGNDFRGATLMDLARASLQRAGVNAKGMDKRAIVAAAFQSTSDFPVLLENTIHKVLLQAYVTTADTWSRFCKVGSVSDFRAHNRYRTGSIGNLDSLNENGEFKHKAIPDGEKSSITAGTKGNIIAITREAIINDDLQALTDLAQMLGRAFRRTIESAVYALLAENSGMGPLLADGKAIFHADHNNIGAGAAISMASLEADSVLMSAQKDVSNNDFLDISPDVLLVPKGLRGTARTINEAEYDPDTANKLHKPNISRGMFSDIVDTQRMTGTRRYAFASVNDAPVIEVAFLDGVQEPYIETKDGWSTDGAELKVRGDFGVAGIDYRGAVTNAGV